MSKHVIIIAEAGVNHNGSIEIAKRLVDEAVRANVDYIKFQTFKSEGVVTKKAEKADYQKANTGTEENTQLELIKKLEIPYDGYLEIIDYCKQKGVKFFSTSTDPNSIEFLASLHLGMWKIPSGEVTNYHFLKKIAGYNQETYFSLGMCDLEMVREAVKILFKNGLDKDKLTLLHCNTEYPTPIHDVNLRVMDTLRKEFGVKVGYSDHTLGIEVPIAAVAMGADVIEKHFTLDRNMEGPDHKASLEPDELCEMVRTIRNVEQAMGDGVKRITDSESRNIIIARKSIVASRTIKKGELLTEENLTTKRPGNGISPMKWNEVVGKTAIKDFEEDEPIAL
ncbi:MAG: N-acetylneuraminate synthase [Bacteroidales bacterium]|nr:N-acetylneuraminate synthase [Bacteroidales bacterium]